MIGLVLLLVCTPSLEGAADPWAVTGTSSTAEPPDVHPDHTVERRLFQKRGRIHVRTGFAYLSRGDLYASPGLAIGATYHPAETLGLELTSTIFFSSLTATAAELHKATGLVPDSQEPRLWLAPGVRLSFAYGKLLIEPLDTVVHLDASAAVHAGLFLTADAPNFAGDAGLALEALFFGRMLVSIEAGWLVGYERRTSSRVASGPMATLGLGAQL